MNGWKGLVSSKSEGQLARQPCSHGPFSSQKRKRENVGNKVNGKRLPCDLLDIVNNKFEPGCSIKRQIILLIIIIIIIIIIVVHLCLTGLVLVIN